MFTANVYKIKKNILPKIVIFLNVPEQAFFKNEKAMLVLQKHIFKTNLWAHA